jgi:riboflavin kinase/FMN adenylyltransferase
MPYFYLMAEKMKLVLGAEALKGFIKGSVATVGNFDGVHIAHQSLIRKTCAKAISEGLPSIVMTFDPHPAKLLSPQKDFQNIFNLSDRIEHISKINPDYLIVEPFGRSLSELSPEEFFNRLLIKICNVKFLFVGHDFSFGKDRAGSLGVLEKLCRENQVGLNILESLKVGGEIVSSTKVRHEIKSGGIKKANLFLDRNFYLSGVVVRGDGRGRNIGFKTANLLFQESLLPSAGVYQTVAIVGGNSYNSLTNVGINPTFNSLNAPLKIETHILDFDRDIYGEMIKIEFINFLRPEMKFKSVDELVSQIKKDIKDVRANL